MTILDGDLSGRWKDILRALLNAGLRVDSDDETGRGLKKLLLNWRPSRKVLRVNQVGWVDEPERAFVLGGTKVIGSDRFVAAGHAASPLAAEMRPQGNLDDWKDTVGRMCSGNPLMLVGVSLAFFGPLQHHVGRDMGGGLHLVGNSSSGKTTIAETAASAWGSPKLKQSWNSTVNGLEAVAGATNGTILILDEIGEAQGKDVDNVIYRLPNGTGRARAHSDTSLRHTTTWATPLLSTGEKSVASKLADAGITVMPGQLVRVIDVRADDRHHGAFDDLHDFSSPAKFADHLKQASGRSFGTAGPAFVECLLNSFEQNLQRFHQITDKIHGDGQRLFPDASDALAGRVLQRLSFIGAAGELATEFGITGWEQGEASDAALSAFEAWIRHSGKS